MTREQIRAILADVTDPEIPVLTLEDLGVIRDVIIRDDTVEVVITPTYSGCPATDLMSRDIVRTLRGAGVENVIITRRIDPPWTTDLLSDEAKQKLKDYGIAPPVWMREDQSVADITVPCPRCGSTRTELISEFGSTACKALYRCQDCLEPFDHFKCHR